jgi:hypothetical protein
LIYPRAARIIPTIPAIEKITTKDLIIIY